MLALERAPVWQSEQYFSKVAAAAGAPASAADRVRWEGSGATRDARGATGVLPVAGAVGAAAAGGADARSAARPPG